MDTSVNYSMEKKGWVIVSDETGFFFKTCDNSGLFWFKTTMNLGDAYFFTSKSKAVAFAKSKDLDRRKWLVAPAKFTTFVEATKGVKIANGRVVSSRKR